MKCAACHNKMIKKKGKIDLMVGGKLHIVRNLEGVMKSMLLEFGKAKSPPDKVRQVVENLKTNGLATTVNAVRSKLDQPLPSGYFNVGTVIAQSLMIGDRMVSNGPHAEMVCMPEKLCEKIPDTVSETFALATMMLSAEP